MENNQPTKLEFNSNVAVLVRTNEILNSINKVRFLLFNPKIEQVTVHDLVLQLIALYKEISVELNLQEEKIWDRLKELRDEAIFKESALTPNTSNFNKVYWRNTINKIDDLDIELRKLAKDHGFLARNQRDLGGSIVT